MGPREIADGWVRAYLLTSQMTRAERERAKDLMIDVAADDPVAAIEAISLVLGQTDDDWVLTNLGAGPIEDLLGSSPRAMLKLLATHPNAAAVAVAIDNVWTASLDEPVAEELARIRADSDLRAR
jgi:hypothetical protein